jgi:CubicO group peptidase (beta-lactamase class C family)
LNAIVIGVDGTVVAAEAFRGPAVDRAVNVKSVSKTIVAALTGIAIDRGDLPGTEATLGEVAPGLIPRGADSRVAGITVADLLTMQAGLERTSGGNYGGWVASRNWVADALSRPMVGEPGEGMLYSTGSYHVLGAVLTEATGRSLLEQARDGLGRPLDIDVPPWTRDPQGYYMGGNEMALSPLAMFRFGEVYRLGGAVGGTRVLSEDWVEASFAPRTRSFFSGDLYGYGWFLRDVGGRLVAYARGYGGQMIFVVPSLGLTVAITSDPNRPARSDGHVGDLQRLLAQTILPAAESG